MANVFDYLFNISGNFSALPNEWLKSLLKLRESLSVPCGIEMPGIGIDGIGIGGLLASIKNVSSSSVRNKTVNNYILRLSLILNSLKSDDSESEKARKEWNISPSIVGLNLNYIKNVGVSSVNLESLKEGYVIREIFKIKELLGIKGIEDEEKWERELPLHWSGVDFADVKLNARGHRIGSYKREIENERSRSEENVVSKTFELSSDIGKSLYRKMRLREDVEEIFMDLLRR